MRASRCRRFRALHEVRESEPLTVVDSSFFETHLASCESCREFDASAATALSLLRTAALEPEISQGFEDRVIRKLKVQTGRESFNYWSPALVGAAIACVAIFATLQLAATPVQMEQARIANGEARRMDKQDDRHPSLVLEQAPRFDP
jgi:predicted anti-sigma-YlaC factor YlaD